MGYSAPVCSAPIDRDVDRCGGAGYLRMGDGVDYVQGSVPKVC